MLTKRGKELKAQIELNSLENLVLEDYILRKVDKAIAFDFIYDKVVELYYDFGRPTINLVVLIKIVLIQYLFGLPSIRTEKTVDGATTKYYLYGDKVILEDNGTVKIYYSYDSSDKLVSTNLNGSEYYYVRNV